MMKDSDGATIVGKSENAANPDGDKEALSNGAECIERRQGERRSGIERRDPQSSGANKSDRSKPDRRRAERRSDKK
ncbi:hypothetical protein [Nitrosospira briensis]|uniref:hypothetical protein n=1 Tax=Nitrosospira briensis TaxID=35799 RepID=UPI001160B8DD|nr:hypothetical protein [Nitrosospira briensis]